jgi:ribonuclease BN (tRNA processing enzyme)
MRLHVLGSGDAFNSAGALHSCYFLEHAAGKLMLECGPSALAGLKRAGIPSDAPDALLISHLHGDHFGGVPFLLLEYLFSNPRSRPLVIAGPPTTAQRVWSLYGELYREAHCREIRFDIDWVVAEPGSSFRLAGFDVRAFEVPHTTDPVSLGYRIESPEGIVVFSGDSAWTDAFVEQTRGSDLFLCECCSLQPETKLHTSYADILANRARLGCKRLLLTHLGADIRAAPSLDVERAHDGMTVEIAPRAGTR